VKYALILLCAMLVGCGGDTKAQQATAYELATDNYDAAISAADEVYVNTMAIASTETEQLEALVDLYSTWAGSERIFVDELAAIEWTAEFSESSANLIACIDDAYLLELEVVMSEDYSEALQLADEADKKNVSCNLLAQELGKSLGLQLGTN
jgi:hypothetical protein